MSRISAPEYVCILRTLTCIINLSVCGQNCSFESYANIEVEQVEQTTLMPFHSVHHEFILRLKCRCHESVARTKYIDKHYKIFHY